MTDFTCELCGDTLTSYRAVMECEARCETETKEARRPNPRTVITRVRWADE